MAPKSLKRPAAAMAKKPAAAGAKRGRPASAVAGAKRGRPAGSKRPATAVEEPELGSGPSDTTATPQLQAFVINLERRPDRWERVQKMLQAEVPGLKFEHFKASDGSQNPIPEEEVAATWNTRCNAHYADYYEWVYDAPGTPRHGTRWKWACETSSEDETWRFTEHGDEEWSYIHHAPGFQEGRTAALVEKATSEEFQLRLQFASDYLEPGKTQRMSGGERGCAHSHLRLWRLAAEREEPTLALEDDVQLVFERADGSFCNGKVFTQRLARCLELLPPDFDVLYLGWSGWRGGHLLRWKQEEDEVTEKDSYLRKAEYVWTTVAYVISQAGARKLLSAATPLNQPVDNFMAWEASQGRLNAFVALDEADDDGTWAGGIVDQFDFQGDSDIKKSDGGHQGDDEQEFAVQE